MLLKIAVSVVRSRPSAPFAELSRDFKSLFPALAARAVYSFARRSGGLPVTRLAGCRSMDSHGAISASPPPVFAVAVSWRRAICDGPGAVKIRTELLPIGGSVTLAFLYCNRCCWEIDQVQLRQPPCSI